MKNILYSIDPVYLGSELQKARAKAGITQEEAASKIGVSRPTLSNIENGVRKVQADELIKMSRLYDYPLNDLTRVRPQVNSFEPLFRGPIQKDADIAKDLSELEDLVRNSLELEQITNSFIKKNYPDQYNTVDLDIEQAGEELATDERRRLGWGDQPIGILRDQLEREVGLRIFYMPLSKNYSAMYIYDSNAGGCISINSNHPEERRRWSLSHEYAHFLAHRYNPDLLNEENSSKLYEKERFANTFTAFFLMPRSALLKKFNDIKRSQGSIKLADLCIIAREFGVSVEALIRQSERIKLLSSGFWDELQQGKFKPAAMTEALGLPEIPANNSFLPTRYKHLALEALLQKKISEGQFARFLRIEKIEARYIIEQLVEGKGI
jgi:Zn-dependent peptidase ImmA (M78 family)/DNA-binding XRE family transcriptional regulator